jgi:hypothetical protein
MGKNSTLNSYRIQRKDGPLSIIRLSWAEERLGRRTLPSSSYAMANAMKYLTKSPFFFFFLSAFGSI